MSLDPERVETVTVDSYGTLVDPHAVEEALAAEVDEPEPISKLWRSRSLTYSMVGTIIGEYQRFYDLNRAGLRYALDVHDVDIDDKTCERILAAYHELSVFDDVRDGIASLRSGGYEVYVVSNGNPEMLQSLVDHAEIGDLVEDTVSAHEIETYKPDAEIYRHAAARTGTPIRNIVHVAGPTFDVQGAQAAGMQSAWLNREDDPWERFGDEPDLEIESFRDLADELGV